jgi:hypothetical protein
MPTVREAVEALAAEFDAATTAVANKLISLEGQLAGASTPEAVDAVLRPVLDRLKVLGASATEPIPTDPAFPV